CGRRQRAGPADRRDAADRRDPRVLRSTDRGGSGCDELAMVVRRSGSHCRRGADPHAGVSDRPIRFATQSGGAPTGAQWLDRAKRLEAIGYATLSMPDHMVGGAWSNLPALGAAAAATTTLRLGNLVLDNDFRNPVVLARELATLDVISEGRVEIGLGAGWFDRDYQSIGAPFDRRRVRVERLGEAVALMKRPFIEDEVTFAGRYYRTEGSQCRPETVQRPHPQVLGRSIYARIGTLEQIRDQIRENRQRLGISYFCLRGPHVEGLAPVVQALRGT